MERKSISVVGRNKKFVVYQLQQQGEQTRLRGGKRTLRRDKLVSFMSRTDNLCVDPARSAEANWRPR